MRGAAVAVLVLAGLAPAGCRRKGDEPAPAPSPPPPPAAAPAERDALATPARFDVSGYEGTLRIEVLASEVVAGPTPDAARGIRATVRLVRDGNEDAGVALGTVSDTVDGAANATSVWSASSKTGWTGVVPARGHASVWFEDCELSPGVPAPFAGVEVRVVPRVLDDRHVAFDVKSNVIVCIK